MSDWGNFAEADYWDQVETEQHELDVAFVMKQREANDGEVRRRREESASD